MKLEEMIGCPHTVRCLNRAGIETMEQLFGYTLDDLLKIRGGQGDRKRRIPRPCGV